MKKIVFFDRDGTIIFDKIYLNDPDAIEYLPGVFEGMNQLKNAGYEFIIVTNQSGVPRGLVDVKNLDEIHRRIQESMRQHGLEILHFYYAPYLVESNHPMRKPGPGMLLAGIDAYEGDPARSWMVGDRMTDVEAGRRANMKGVFLHGTEVPTASEFENPEHVAKDFPQVVEIILKNDSSS